MGTHKVYDNDNDNDSALFKVLYLPMYIDFIQII